MVFWGSQKTIKIEIYGFWGSIFFPIWRTPDMSSNDWIIFLHPLWPRNLPSIISARVAVISAWEITPSPSYSETPGFGIFSSPHMATWPYYSWDGDLKLETSWDNQYHSAQHYNGIIQSQCWVKHWHNKSCQVCLWLADGWLICWDHLCFFSSPVLVHLLKFLFLERHAPNSERSALRQPLEPCFTKSKKVSGMACKYLLASLSRDP